MTILDQIIKSKSNSTHESKTTTANSKYPIHISTDSIFPNLNFTKQNPNPNLHPLFEPLSGFQISNPDLGLIDLNSKYCDKFESLFKIPGKTPNLLISLITDYLENVGEIKFGGSIDLGFQNDGDLGFETDGFGGYCSNLLKKLGSFVGLDVMSLIIDGCFIFGTYDVLEVLIVNGFVDYSLRSSLLVRLMENRYDLVCLCVRSFGEVDASDLGEVLRLFLSPSLCKERNVRLDRVKKEWESDALSVIDRVSMNMLTKDASLLLMLAYDEFTPLELCLHSVLSSQSVDDVVFASAISKLDMDQLLGLIRYLVKWLRKYQRFPQVGPCPEAVLSLGLKMCQWVPRVEDVIKCLCLVVDEHFSSLSMQSEFHEELKAVEEIVSSLVCEGRLTTSIANLIDILKPETGDA